MLAAQGLAACGGDSPGDPGPAAAGAGGHGNGGEGATAGAGGSALAGSAGASGAGSGGEGAGGNAPVASHAHGISSSIAFSCALGASRNVLCWGGTEELKLPPPPSGEFQDLTSSDSLFCGVSGGEVKCWGGPIPTLLTSETQLLAVGSTFLCGVDGSGALHCTGARKQMLESAFGGQRLSALASGRDFLCGLTEDGRVTCAGDNQVGQIDSPSGKFDFLAAGRYHACALDSAGHAQCWGAGKSGDADDAETPPLERIQFAQSVPPSGVSFVSLGLGHAHSCGIQADGSVACWGAGVVDNDCAGEGFDQCGQAAPPAGKFTEVSGGYTHTCARREDGGVTCWGSDSGGRSTPPAELQ